MFLFRVFHSILFKKKSRQLLTIFENEHTCHFGDTAYIKKKRFKLNKRFRTFFFATLIKNNEHSCYLAKNPELKVI